MEVTPRAITVLFPPSYWDRMARDHEHEIRNLCEAVGNSLRRVLQHEKGHA